MNDSRSENIVLHAIQVAEKAHRTRPQGPHLRKAPNGEDRPYYFVHLAEVAWMLSNTDCDRELVAADVLTLSCVDKTVNIREMCSWLKQGYLTQDFTKKDHATQLAKFDALDQIYQEPVAQPIVSSPRLITFLSTDLWSSGFAKASTSPKV